MTYCAIFCILFVNKYIVNNRQVRIQNVLHAKVARLLRHLLREGSEHDFRVHRGTAVRCWNVRLLRSTHL